MHSRIMPTVLGLVAEIEWELIALRTREALAKRKVEGKPLGRPKGQQAAQLNFNAMGAEIRAYLAKRISKRATIKLVEYTPSTLYEK